MAARRALSRSTNLATMFEVELGCLKLDGSSAANAASVVANAMKIVFMGEFPFHPPVRISVPPGVKASPPFFSCCFYQFCLPFFAHITHGPAGAEKMKKNSIIVMAAGLVLLAAAAAKV